jgi:hypothetical protein
VHGDLAIVQEGPAQAHAAELVVRGPPVRPARLRHDLGGRGAGARIDPGDQALFPRLAFELPEAERDEDREDGQGRKAGCEERAVAGQHHRCRRPSSALW